MLEAVKVKLVSLSGEKVTVGVTFPTVIVPVDNAR